MDLAAEAWRTLGVAACVGCQAVLSYYAWLRPYFGTNLQQVSQCESDLNILYLENDSVISVLA